ncbi:MAG: hypothetical protein AVO34_04890 [Firmicutes bacterium ML8_F2]|nr:MAG: hypothetical protein AVO34_04890 [Firmicutes bacterium ML8_F2]
MNESLWNIKTIRDIQKPGDVFSMARVKTTSSLGKIEKSTPYTIDEELLMAQKKADRQWFFKQNLAISKARNNLLRMRSKLKSIKEQNKRRCNYRKELMRERLRKEAGSNQSALDSQDRNNCNPSFFIEY